MLNKSLESILRDSGYLSCIPLIEVCESDKNIKVIEVDEKKGFTNSVTLNKQIEKYLEELNIKIKYVNMKNRLKEIDTLKDEKNEKEIKKQKCTNSVHATFKRPMTKNKKVEMYTNYKMNLFSIDKDTYVNCPDCGLFEKL